VVNLADSASQGWIKVPWDDLKGRVWRLNDAFTARIYERDGDQMRLHGLYVDLPAWGFHFLEWL
jgi:hypothetical protein